MEKHDMRLLAVLAGAAIAVSACGGGGGGGGDDTVGGGGTGTNNTIPASALASMDSLVAYAKELLRSASDSAEPISLGDAKLPTSEAAEPFSVN